MRHGAAFLALGLLMAATSCSSTEKTRLDCFNECKMKRLKWSGIISRDEKEDADGNREIKEVCRCSIEEPI